MGLYDEVTIEYPLPADYLEWQERIFQTKSLGNALDSYTITKDGRLVYHKATWEMTAKEERDEHNMPMFKVVSYEDIELSDFHGDIELHDYADGYFVELVARFTHGQLESIQTHAAGQAPRSARLKL